MDDSEMKGGGGGGGVVAADGEARETAKQQEYAKWSRKEKTNFDFGRVMYCVGSVSRVDNVIQNYYLSPFLLDVVGLRAAYVGNVLLVKQLWDAITDPFVGYLSDNTQSSLGRRKPYIYFATPFLWASWILSWTDFEAIENQGVIMLYFIAVLLVFNLSNTCQQVPYRALLQDAAPTYGIRTRMVMVQEMIAMFSFMLASLLHSIIITKFKNVYGSPNYQLGYIVSALIFAPVIAFVRPFTCNFVTEMPILEGDGQFDEEDEGDGSDPKKALVDERKNKTYLDSLREFLSIWVSAIRFRDFSLLSLAWFLANAVVNLVQSNIILYTKYYLEAGGWGKLVVTFLQMGIAISLPLWGQIIKRIGKKRSLLVGCFLLCLLFIGCFFLPSGKVIYFIVVISIAGCVAGSLYICLTAMQPDCVEAYFLKTHKRHEAILYSLFLLAGKVGGAVAQAGSSYVLALTGYEAAKNNIAVEQNNATLLALRILMFIAPLGLMVLICIIVAFIKDYKKEFGTSTDRATVSGMIISERVSKRVKGSSHVSHSSNSTPEIPRASRVRFADQE